MYHNKQIIFDLDTKVAAAILGKSYNNIYYKIKNILMIMDLSI